MEPVHLPFVAYPKIDLDGAGETRGEAQQIEKGGLAVSLEIAPEEFEMVSGHMQMVMS